MQNGQASHLTNVTSSLQRMRHIPTSHTFIYVLQLTQQLQLPHRHVSEVQCSSSMEVVNPGIHFNLLRSHSLKNTTVNAGLSGTSEIERLPDIEMFQLFDRYS